MEKNDQNHRHGTNLMFLVAQFNPREIKCLKVGWLHLTTMYLRELWG